MSARADDGPIRHGTLRWLSEPPHGRARVIAESGAFSALPVSVPDSDPRQGDTTPGELLAVAYSAFIGTHLAQRLEDRGTPATELVVDVWCRLSADVRARSLEGLKVEVRARVPIVECQAFENAAHAALAASLDSLGIRPGVPTELDASLVPPLAA
jgi:organic hydroperoxide reductase OsmC/OhrA